MKKFLLILGITILILLVAGVIFLSRIQFNDYIPQIRELAKEKWGTDVSLEDLRLSFKEGISLQAKEVKWNYPGPSEISGRVPSFYLTIRFLPLFIGQVEISKIVLSDPEVMVLQRKVEVIEPAEEPALPASKEEASVSSGKSKKDGKAAFILLPSLARHINLKSVSIKNGRLQLKDDKSAEAKNMIFEAINLSASHIQLTKPFRLEGSCQFNSIPIDLKGRLGPLGHESQGQPFEFYPMKDLLFKMDLSADNFLMPFLEGIFPELSKESSNIRIRGSESLSLKTEGSFANFKIQFFETATQQSVDIKHAFKKDDGVPLELSASAQWLDFQKLIFDRILFRLDGLVVEGKGETATAAGQPAGDLSLKVEAYSLRSLDQLLPDLKGANLTGDLSAEVSFKGFDKQTNQAVLNGALRVVGFSVKPPAFAEPLRAESILITFQGNRLAADRMSLGWGGGRILAQSEIQDLFGSPQLLSRGRAEKINLDTVLLPPKEKAPTLGGLLFAAWDLQAKRERGKAFSEVLNGTIALDIADGAIRNLNIIDEVSKQTSKIPVLGGNLRAALEKRFPRLANSPDTEFKRAHLEGIFAGGVARGAKFFLEAPEFSVVGNGDYELRSQGLNFRGNLIFSPEATRELISMVRELENLTDASGQLSFPFTVSGARGKYGVSLLGEVVQDALQKILMKKGAELLFGKTKKSESGAEGESSAAMQENSGESDPLDELVQYGLDKLLKSKKNSS